MSLVKRKPHQPLCHSFFYEISKETTFGSHVDAIWKNVFNSRYNRYIIANE